MDTKDRFPLLSKILGTLVIPAEAIDEIIERILDWLSTNDVPTTGASAYPFHLRDDFLSRAELSFFQVLRTMTGQQVVACAKLSLGDLFFAQTGDPRKNRAVANRIDRKHVDFLLCESTTNTMNATLSASPVPPRLHRPLLQPLLAGWMVLVCCCGSPGSANGQPLIAPSASTLPTDTAEDGGLAPVFGRREVEQFWIVKLSEPALGQVGGGAAVRAQARRAQLNQQDAVIARYREIRAARPRGFDPLPGPFPVPAPAPVPVPVPEPVRRMNNCLNAVVFRGTRQDMNDLEARSRVDGNRGDVVQIMPALPVAAHLQQSVPQIRADIVHSRLNATGVGVVVAVIDTGVDYRHADLGAGIGPGKRVIGGYDFINNRADPLDDNGHGTHVAGIIAANGVLRGVAPDCRLLAYKALDKNGAGTTDKVLAAIDRAMDPDDNPATDDAAHIINLSLGGLGHAEDLLCEAVNNAVRAGITCVVSAGNGGGYETVNSPAIARDAIAVGSVTRSNVVSGFSSRGPGVSPYLPKPDLCAPGEDIFSLGLDNRRERRSGTSMAAPHIAGVAALLRQLHPGWRAAEIRTALLAGALPLGDDVATQGAGRVDAFTSATTPLLGSPGALSLGHVNLTGGDFRTNLTLSLSNASTAPLRVSYKVELPPGVTLRTFAYPTRLAPGEARPAAAEFLVRAKSVPRLGDTPFMHEGAFVFIAGTNRLRIPFSVSVEPPDSFEPNNDRTNAATITITEVRRQIVGLGRTRIDPTQPGAGQPDEDWFRFAARKGQRLYVYCDAGRIGSSLAPVVRVYQVGKTNQLNGSSNRNNDAQMVDWPIPEDSDYLLRVTGDAWQPTGPYRLYANFQPADVITLPRPTNIENPVNLVRFSAGGHWLATSRAFNYLALFDPGQPTNTLMDRTGGGGEFGLAELTVGVGAGPGIHSGKVVGFDLNAVRSFVAAAREGTTLAVARQVESSDENWALTSAAWSRVVAPVNPGRVDGAAAAWDAARGEIVLFGGREATRRYTQETWLRKNGQWRQAAPSSSPPSRVWHSMSYDPNRAVVVMFGGYSFRTSWLADTWEWNGAEWKEVNTPAPRPPPVTRSVMDYDPVRKVMVLVAMNGGTAETWEYKDAKWVLRQLAVNPPGSWEMGLCYDRPRGEFVLVTMGAGLETWTYNGSAWTRRAPATIPSVYPGGFRMAFDEVAAAATLVSLPPESNSGHHGPFDVWLWQGDTWRRSAAVNAPPLGRAYPTLVWDRAASHFLLLGGLYGQWEAPHQLEVYAAAGNGPPRFTRVFDFPDMMTGVAVSPDGSRIVTATAAGITVQNPAGDVLQQLAVDAPGSPRRLSHDNRVLHLARRTNTAYVDTLMDLSTGTERFRAASYFDDLRMSADATRLVRAVKRAYGYAWTGTNYQTLWRFDPAPDEHLLHADISTNGQTIAVLGSVVGRDYEHLGLVSYFLDAGTGKILSRCRLPSDPAVTFPNAAVELKIRDDGQAAAFAAWGGDRQFSEFTVVGRDMGTPLLSLGTTGSGRTVDIAGDFAAFGSKYVHAFIGSGFGYAYLAPLAARLANAPPSVYDTSVTRGRLSPGQTVTLTTHASAVTGVTNVTASIRQPASGLVGTIALADDGRHGDGKAGDGVWGGYWKTPATGGDYRVDVQAVDRRGTVGVHRELARFTTRPGPWIVVEKVAFTNGLPLQSGTNWFTLALKNTGSQPARDTIVSIALNGMGISELTDQMPHRVGLGDLPSGASALTRPNTLAVVLSTPPPLGTTVTLSVLVHDRDGHAWRESIVIDQAVVSQAGKPANRCWWQ